MATSTEKTVAGYLASLPPDRRAAMKAVRAVIRKNLPKGFREGMFGMIGYYVPLKDFPDTYNGDPLFVAGLASQKQYMAVYLLGCYGDAKLARWFQAEYKKRGKKLDMGKSCVRFKTLDDLPLELVGEVIARVSVDQLTAMHDAAHGKPRKGRSVRA
jgi:hypothetical protein